MTAEEYAKGNVISFQQMEALSGETSLAPYHLNNITNNIIYSMLAINHLN